MRILIAAGDKTENIANPLKSRFKSGAVTVASEMNIEGVKALVYREKPLIGRL